MYMLQIMEMKAHLLQNIWNAAFIEHSCSEEQAVLFVFWGCAITEIIGAVHPAIAVTVFKYSGQMLFLSEWWTQQKYFSQI